MLSTDYIWLIVCACFVFFMQAGFVCYEVGFAQSKNVVSIALENILAFVIATLVFSTWGYGLMFGPSWHGIWGNVFSSLSILGGTLDLQLFAHVFFQLMFAATAVTIFASSMSERTKLNTMIIAAIFTAGVIYPLYGHWVWGGNYSGQLMWLKKIGFIDFAGATVVHATAGWIALAGIIVVGARRGRFDEQGKVRNLGRSNIPFATLGTFILWFGWFGFNGGSVPMLTGRIAIILLNTNLSAAAGVVGALFVTQLFSKNRSYMEAVFSGALGGLVAITAGSNILMPMGSCIVGFVAGSVVVLSALFLERLRLDDVVGAVPIHAFGGVTGTIMLALFAPSASLLGGSRLAQLGIQTAGVLTNFAWSFGTGLILFVILDRVIGLRVTPEQEEKGLNIVEYNDIYSWLDFHRTVNYENQLYEQNLMLKRQSRLLIATQEQERMRLGRDLHDGVGQVMAAIKLQLGMLIDRLRDKNKPEIEKDIHNTINLVESATEEMRGIIMNLRPAKLSEYGLRSAIRDLANNVELSTGLVVRPHSIERIPKWGQAIELNIYRVIQEALANTTMHAFATKVDLAFYKATPNSFSFAVIDNGRGFDQKTASSGIGLVSMQERAAMIGGHLDIRSSIGVGTSVVLEVPIGQDSDIIG
jgi:Amt family ammonium transporter